MSHRGSCVSTCPDLLVLGISRPQIVASVTVRFSGGSSLDNGILELDNNAAERGMRAIALGRKNYLFVGSEAGGKAAAIAYTLIETAKLNAVDPNAWLADTLARIPDYKITKVDDLLPWKWRQ